MPDQPEGSDPQRNPSDDNDFSVYNIETRRLEWGPIGEALASVDRPAEQLAENILRSLDREDGWIVVNESGGSWYPGRLGVEFNVVRSPDDQPFLRIDTEVVRLAAETRELHAQLNELNVQAAGWWWWFDRTSRTVMCSIQAVADPTEWWWPNILLGIMPLYATVTESMADHLADRLQGEVLAKEHPERGLRPEVDGHILGTRLGPREPSASLDMWISQLEYTELNTALKILADGPNVEVDSPLFARVEDAAEQARIVLRRHWHPELGWGWQFVSLTGISILGDTPISELHLTASQLNVNQWRNPNSRNRFGGWVCVPDLGLVHHTFIPASQIELLAAYAGSTIGSVAALMVDPNGRMQDLADGFEVAQPNLDGPLIMNDLPDDVQATLTTVNLSAGPIGWPYFDPIAQENFTHRWSTGETGGERAGEDLWVLPRHLPFCSFGIFNPMGPTVSSLEAALVPLPNGGIQWSLYWVLRHPLSPEIVHLGDALTLSDLSGLIVRSLTDQEQNVFGTGPEWLDIWDDDEAILEGVRKFAILRGDEDWQSNATELMVHASNPWARVTEGVEGMESEWPPGLDPVDGWIGAITHLDVIAGHQLFIRSAWEGSRAWADSGWSDADAAQTASDAASLIAQARAQDDYDFRESEGRFVRHPRS